jgi:pimeloyl-ACP methyl ester carboxylesterase
MLMVHGLFSMGAFYYKHAHELRDQFDITAIDLLGQSLSGRPEFNLLQAQDVIDLFVYSIEAWMIQTGYRSAQYVLAGHSIGGYICSNYALAFPSRLSHLILFSVNGI